MSALRLLPKRKPKVFVCYRRDDSGGYAGRIYADLVRHFGKKQIFLDINTIAGGDDFPKVTEKYLGSCDIFIGVIGKRWLTISDGDTRRLEKPDDFVRREIAGALNRQIPIIQVLVQGASSLSQQSLPPELEALAHRQAVEISDSRWEFDIKQLINRIEEALPARPIAWQKLVVLVTCLTLLILGLVVGYLNYNNSNRESTVKSPDPKTSPLPEPSASKRDVFPVDLSVSEYQKTGICVEQGARLQITAQGTISLGPNIRSTNPSGKNTFTGPLGIELQIDPQYYKELSFPLGALMCKLDSEQKWQKCGERKIFVAAAPGCIEFEINDRKQDDNYGAYSVQVDLHK